MKEQFSKIIKSRFLRSAGTISGGAAAAQLIAFASSPILTRLYTPDAYGILALMLGFVTIAVTAASLHYELAIALPKREEDAGSITALAMFLGIIVSILSVLVFAPALGDFLGRFGFATLRTYWWLLPLTLFATALHQALMFWHIRKQRFKEVAANGVVQSLTQNGAPILFAGLGFTAVGLLLGITVSRIVAAGGFLWRAIKFDRAVLTPNVPAIQKLVKEYWTFPTIGLAGALLHVGVFQLPAFLLTDVYGAAVAGFFLLQDRVLGVPLAVLSQGLAGVFYVNAAKLANDDPKELKRSYFQLLRNLSLAGIVPVIILVLFAPWMFKLVFGAEWETAGEYARLMAVPTFLRFVAGPLYRCLTILKQQLWILLFDGIGILMLLAIPRFASEPIAGVKIVAAALSITYAGLLAAATVAVMRKARRGEEIVTGAAQVAEVR